MRQIFIIAILALFGGALVSRAEEQLPSLKIGSEVYSNVTVIRVSVTDIYFMHSKGVGNAKLKNLDPEMQKHFGYNAAAAKAAEQMQNASSVQYHFRVASATNPPPKIAAEIKSERDDAIARVKAIVNQPVTKLRETPEMKYETGFYNQGWFHPGATKPNFNTVDVRVTRETNYAKNKYVTSSLNSGVVFLGNELEFNSMTKYFYTDHSLPKKKLTEAEMWEINRLYRIIGQDEALIRKLDH